MLPMLLLVTTFVTHDTTTASPRMPDYPHVRTTDARFQRLIEDAARRSRTFAQLYARLQDTDVILFVEPSCELRKDLMGKLVFVAATPLARYLRAEIRADLPPTELIFTIAHEMQHALETATGLVRDQAAMTVLYRHIGLGVGKGMFETEEAQAVARRVRRELLA